MKSWLQDNNVETYSTSNEGISVAAARFINKICKYITSVLKSVCIDKVDDIVNKYNNTHHRTIKIKHVNVERSIYIDFNKENDKENPKFKVSDNVRISKYKNIFANFTLKIGLKKFLL